MSDATSLSADEAVEAFLLWNCGLAAETPAFNPQARGRVNGVPVAFVRTPLDEKFLVELPLILDVDRGALPPEHDLLSQALMALSTVRWVVTDKPRDDGVGVSFDHKKAQAGLAEGRLVVRALVHSTPERKAAFSRWFHKVPAEIAELDGLNALFEPLPQDQSVAARELLESLRERTYYWAGGRCMRPWERSMDHRHAPGPKPVRSAPIAPTAEGAELSALISGLLGSPCEIGHDFPVGKIACKAGWDPVMGSFWLEVNVGRPLPGGAPGQHRTPDFTIGRTRYGEHVELETLIAAAPEHVRADVSKWIDAGGRALLERDRKTAADLGANEAAALLASLGGGAGAHSAGFDALLQRTIATPVPTALLFAVWRTYQAHVGGGDRRPPAAILQDAVEQNVGASDELFFACNALLGEMILALPRRAALALVTTDETFVMLAKEPLKILQSSDGVPMLAVADRDGFAKRLAATLRTAPTPGRRH